jgi:glycosyltransferase involved in cell wall biosynthesis
MISVALCTYNGARFLREQLESIASQKVLPAEIVISDDNSSDSTSMVLDQFEASLVERRLPITVRRFTNQVPLGVAKNFERAVTECRGELIAFCDQDDIWMPTKIERLAGLLEARPEVDLVFTNAILIQSGGKALGKSLFSSLRISRKVLSFETQDWFPLLLQRNVATGATVVFRADLGRRAMPFPSSWLHDEWLAMWASVTGHIFGLDENLIGYRQHESNQVGVARLTARVGFAKILGARRARNSALKARASSLHLRVANDSRISQFVRISAKEKLQHEVIRSSLASARLHRLVPVWREYATGRYQKYGLGIIDAVRDVLQRDS